jgi:hypothetical protein
MANKLLVLSPMFLFPLGVWLVNHLIGPPNLYYEVAAFIVAVVAMFLLKRKYWPKG